MIKNQCFPQAKRANDNYHFFSEEGKVSVQTTDQKILDIKLAQSILEKTPPNHQPSRAAQINSYSAMITGFVSQVMIERKFFQNTHIPAQILMTLANDLIQTVQPQKDHYLSVPQELSIIWKQVRGKTLTTSDEEYLASPREMNVVGEVLNGVKYSSLALLGQSFVQSVTSTVSQRLWTHLPSVCGYFGMAMMGPQALQYGVSHVLNKSSLTKHQQTLVEPWLNTIGRLALGLLPKVHATNEGVHYQYPSRDGHHQTFTPEKITTQKGENLFIETSGELDTPEGSYPGTHHVAFKIGKITTLTEEKIVISVTDGQDQTFPVTFTSRLEGNTPRIIVSSPNAKLEQKWSAYFQPASNITQPLSLPSPTPSLIQSFSLTPSPSMPKYSFPSLNYPNMLLTSLLSVVASNNALRPVGREATWAPVLLSALLSLSQGINGFSLKRWIAKKVFGGVLEDAQQTAVVTLENADRKVNGWIERVENLEGVFKVDLKEVGTLLIQEIGNQVRVTVKEGSQDLAEGTKATIRVGGEELRFTIGEVGKVAEATVKFIGEELRLTTQEVGKESRLLVGEIARHGNEIIANFGDEQRLFVKQVGETFEITASKAMQQLIEGSKTIIKVGGEEARLTIQQGEKSAVVVLNRVEEIVDNLPGRGGTATEHWVIKFFKGIKKATWGESEFSAQKEIIREKYDLSKNGQEVKKAFNQLLPHTHGQHRLTPQEKAHLYVELIKGFNKPSINNEEKLLFSFVVGATAYQDIGCVDKETNYFNETVIKVLERELQQAFTTGNFDEVKDRLKVQLKKLEKELTNLSTPRVQSILYDNDPNILVNREDLPVGTVIAFPGGKMPNGYIPCDGSWVQIDHYPELYAAIGDQYGKREKEFKLPDYRGQFLRGAEKVEEIGKQFQDTTRLPRKPFVTSEGGLHIHELKESGKHSHTSSQAGKHVHEISEGGKHSHKVKIGGSHTHTLKQGGEHKHDMDEIGDHNHEDGENKYLLVGDGHATMIHTDYSANEPNLNRRGKGIQPAGRHKHSLHSAGGHTHSMETSGGHSHTVEEVSGHKHAIHFGGNHHHEISVGGSHTHQVSESGVHNHKISGGDEETLPKNVKVAFFIKARPSQFVKDIENLREELRELYKELNKSNQLNMKNVLSFVGPIALSLLASLFVVKCCAKKEKEKND